MDKPLDLARTAWWLLLLGALLIGSSLSAQQMNLDLQPLPPDVKKRTSYAPMLDQVRPSVVRIYSTRTVRQAANPMLNDPMFRRFFNVPDDYRGERERKESGLGSGVIVSRDGYVLTNNHVIAGADQIKVERAGDDQQYTAKLVGTDPQTDIAVLKIEGDETFPAIPITDSDALEVGDLVFAIGNPFGVGLTVTSGIVSATGRGNLGIADYEDWIQTDASINPGNSGGALVDAQGRLVGINTAIISRTGSAAGIGFAVPSNMARLVMSRIVEYGRMVRGYLGVIIQDLDEDTAEFFKVPDRNGAIVSDVAPDGAAAEAGIQKDDVIVALNDQPVTDVRHLRLLVAQTRPGTEIKVKVLRDGKPRVLEATLKELPDQRVGRTPGPRPTPDAGLLSGVALTALSTDLRQRLEVPGDVQGVVVTGVEPGSAAAKSGLRVNDIIAEINRRPVTDPADAYAAAKGKGRGILLYVWREGNGLYVVVKER